MSATDAQAFWITAPERAELRPADVQRGNHEVLVKTLFTGISRGTERLVFHGNVPSTEHQTMRAPFQEGAFTFPVKYGYSAVGKVQGGPRDGKTVFALFPHQTHFAIPEAAALTVPDAVPANRAVLAANMETALTILWDAGIGPGDKVAVIGSGVVGALVGYLAGRIPGTEVTLIDIDETRASLAAKLGCSFATPDDADGDADVVVHASASDAGFAKAIALAGMEATIVEASWYGARTTQAPLGGPFHQRRLKIIASQVGRIPAHHAARWDYGRRMRKALDLLVDEQLDALISGESEFLALPDQYGSILADPATLCHRISYQA
ncbi:MAG: zinc-binding alcohol dehydrogenase [Pseudomonadota bacterium]